MVLFGHSDLSPVVPVLFPEVDGYFKTTGNVSKAWANFLFCFFLTSKGEALMLLKQVDIFFLLLLFYSTLNTEAAI